MMKKIIIIILFLLNSIFGELSVRIKDIAEIKGLRENQLIGYGIVVGLNGTGDKGDFTESSMKNFLEKLGISAEDFSSKNIASVIVTADIPPFITKGKRIDISVSSIGNAKSIDNGMLLQTPLSGADNKVYAVAQGRVITGKKSPLSGNIVAGAIIERDLSAEYLINGSVILQIVKEDFTTVSEIKKAIFKKLKVSAVELNPAELRIDIPLSYKSREIEFISKLENIEVNPGEKSIVVIDRSTGTIVMNGNVKVSAAAVSQNNIRVEIGSSTNETEKSVKNKTKTGNTLYLGDISDVKNLVKALNEVGVNNTDIAAILCNLNSSGALHGKVIIK